MSRPVGALLACFVLGILTPTPVLAVSLDEAQTELDRLEAFLGRRTAANPDLIAAIEAVGACYGTVDLPEDSGTDAVALRERETAWRARVVDQLADAVLLVRLDRERRNLRTEVNVAATRVLGATGHADATKALRKAWIRLERVRYEVPAVLTEAVFEALARLNDMRSLQWMLDDNIHTRSSPPGDVEQLVATLRAMPLFEKVPGRLRFAVVDKLVTLFSSVESVAESTPSSSQKSFWDGVRNDAIRVVQQFAGPTAVNEEGQALATMAEFQVWFREHKRPNRAPWVDER